MELYVLLFDFSINLKLLLKKIKCIKKKKTRKSCWQVGWESPTNARDTGWIPESGRPPGGGNGNPLQYSCLGNPMDRGAGWATVQGVSKSQDTTENAYTHTNTHNAYMHKEGAKQRFASSLWSICVFVKWGKKWGFLKWGSRTTSWVKTIKSEFLGVGPGNLHLKHSRDSYAH